MPNTPDSYADAEDDYPPDGTGPAVKAGRQVFSGFDSLPGEAWDRRGIASDNPVTVRALAYICAGHLIHHLEILEARYLQEG